MPLVKTHIHEHAGTIILNRPEKRNALSRALLAELSQALDDLHQERQVRAVILAASGPAFCAGMDLSEMLLTSRADDALAQWHRDSVAYRDLVEKMLQFPKPLIAAVGGPAMAGGAGLVLACDLVLATDSATFGLPEPRRGLVAGMVAPLLAFRVGAGRAAYLLLSAKSISAAEAHRVGIYHEMAAADHLWP
ncbi:MAG TPA: enoyl-CoA hydratase/isomerase family protein, partial [Pirellulales bacterium]